MKIIVADKISERGIALLRETGWDVLLPAAAALPSEDDADALLRAALARTSLKDAVAEVAVATGLPRRTLYQQALALADEKKQETE